MIKYFAIFLICISSPRLALGVEPHVVVDEIEIKGVTLFESTALETSLDIQPGDVFVSRKLVRTVETLQSLYIANGYLNTSVKTELRQSTVNGKKKHLLVLNVTEGLPRRIRSVAVISGDPYLSVESAAFWKAIEGKFTSKIGITKGDLFSDEKTNYAKKAILDILAGEEYISAKVTRIKIATVDQAVVSDLKTSDWVDLIIVVDVGGKITFGFQGNKVLGQTELLDLIEQQRIVGFGRDFSESIKLRIIDEYKSRGFSNIEVEVFSFQRRKRLERHFTFKITENQKNVIGSINVDGNIVFTEKELLSQFLSGASSLIGSGVYVEKEVDVAANRLVEWLRSKGYLSSKLIAVNKTFNEARSKVSVVIYIYEGDQTIVGQIRVVGNSVMSNLEITKIIGNSEGLPINLFNLSEGLEKLGRLYRARGFLDFNVTNAASDKLVFYSQENRAADIELNLTEGIQYRLGRIEVEGLTKTRDYIVRREIALSEGDIIEEPLISESEGRLRKLGIFSSASVKILDDPENPSKKILKIMIKEGTPGFLAGGVGFRNDLGIRIFAQTGYANLWHRNHGIFLNANVNRRFDEEFCTNGLRTSDSRDSCFIEYQTQLGYTWPWFVAGETTFRPRINFDQTQYRSFDAKTVSMALTLDRNLIKDPNITGVLTYSLERIRQFNALIDIDNQTLKIGAVTPSIRLDMRDNPLAPSKGVFFLASYELADPAFLSQSEPIPVAYSRSQVRMDAHLPLAQNIGFYFSFRTGIARNLVSPNGVDDKKRAIPLIKHFALGGAGSLRGFKEQELNVYDIAIRGTLNYVNYRAQLDFPLSGALRLGPFLDAANLLVDRYSFGLLRYGSGFGFHYLSPVGPVNFDMGFKLSPKPGEDTSQFYFSIGVI